MHCHHEKTIVIDDRIAFVGGIDLTNFRADRWDTEDHEPRGAVGWHDVAARIAGPAVRDVAENFAMRWQAITGETLPPVATPSSAGGGGGEGGGTGARRHHPQPPPGGVCL